MNLQLIYATKEYKEPIKNLMQFYIYDFSEFLNYDVEKDGLFAPYPDLDNYWKDGNYNFPYIIKKDGKYAGFVLVRFIQSETKNYFSIAEFFILKKYRREQIGKTIAHQIFDIHKGQWEIFQKESNKPAQIFWTKVINEYTKGKFTERLENERRIQDFKSH